ncbi:UDP-N-acetylmuramoyl-L-alanyl-D-glutamate synthetase [Actinoplanes sp. SE50]|uniref:UDP-N-acetylmuramoyl-L-alanine--D-glutamate ligase n=1 Tax=unclassified Actinoplanes TaxID=2626549 RepID=UPI00023ED595|nr:MULTISPECIES: UDP-N-acetylmuramoyl-L-alanine--D-glutamate ligase [unclassified Actinoplanes]AEV82835.1 UDP-N-acetylmuramoyl-L-alanyl-D-glutamate synthetase [Actinoplanes sp. SE50/110]ATO81231.1 UDP-N-acetylmuramoyl-L-alanyl-D-glutamate synthetase [Actinoplanes sp. SE50]SLL98638.1 UDP-N-acetylmuramoylalanine--D-glutamate ligase [Actinoplanes sp. SE50/110]
MRLADLRGRSVAVWGTGREGRAAVGAIAAHEPSRLIAVNDGAGYLDDPWNDPRAPLAGGEHAFAALASADVVVRSPGVPSTHPFMAELRTRGVPVTGGSALWMADHAAATVGVTGSKGKSTTSSLISHLLAAVGRPNAYGGNIGVPLLDLPPAELYVLELSSYQCADLTDSPRVAVVTSLFPEHLDAHGGEREYYRDKLNILAHGPELIVVNGADERLRDEIRGVSDRSGFPPVPAAADDSRFRVEDGTVFCSDDPLFPRSALALVGRHNERNLCVALAVLDGMGVDVVGLRADLEAAVRSFPGLPHRLTEIADPSGVTFVDDTLSTSPYSAMHAVEAYEGRPLTVLLGGTDRGLDYAPLREFLASRELTVIGLPDSGPRILAELSGLPKVTTLPAEDLADAVRLAREVTPAGGVVLLSPAAPSYGRFRNFEHRSEAFAEAIRATAS